MAGRPTILDEEMVKKAREYLGTDKHAKGVLTIEGLAIELDISRQTIYRWADDKELTDDEKTSINDELLEEFCYIVTRVRQQQAEKLIQNGLDGTYNPVITKLLLSKHGYIERKDITSDDKPFQGATVEFVGEDEPNGDEATPATN